MEWHCDWNSHWQQEEAWTPQDHGAWDNWIMYPWGNNDGGYTQTSPECDDDKCLGKMTRCPNWKLCHRVLPIGIMRRGRCLYCDQNFGRNLVFVDDDNHKCPVCLESVADQGMVFPGCPGGHVFCIDCVRTTMYGSYEAHVALKEHICTAEHDEDDDYDPHEDVDIIKGIWRTSKRCPLCQHESVAPWLARMQEEGRA